MRWTVVSRFGQRAEVLSLQLRTCQVRVVDPAFACTCSPVSSLRETLEWISLVDEDAVPRCQLLVSEPETHHSKASHSSLAESTG